MNENKRKKPDALAEKLEGILIKKKFVEQLTEQERRLILESKSGIVANHFDPLRAYLKGEIATAVRDDPSRASATATVRTRLEGILEGGINSSRNLSESKAKKAKAAHKKKIEDQLRLIISRQVTMNPFIKDAEIIRELLRVNPNGSQVYAWLKKSDNDPYSVDGLRPYVKRLADEVRERMKK